MKMMKQMACAALAAAVAVGITGCGSKADYSQPKVAEGTILALAGREITATTLKPICEKYGFGENDLSNLPKEVKELLTDLGLDKIKAKWAAVTVGDITAAVQGKGIPDFAVAIPTTLDLDKTMAAAEKKCKEKKEEDISFKKTTIAGVSAYEIASKKDKLAPCVASLDGQLVLCAASAAGLEKQIALYRDGKGASKDFGAFTLGANDILRVKVVKVGENVKKNLPDPEMLKGVNDLLPDGDKLVLGLGNVDLALCASADGKDVKLDLAVETASDADATKLVTLAQSSLAPLTMMLKDAKDDGTKLAADVLKAVKIEGKGKVATLTTSIAADPALKALADKAKELK